MTDARRLHDRWMRSLVLRGHFIQRAGSSSPTELHDLMQAVRDPGATLVAEIGFNTGLSSHAFLSASPVVKVVSFDLGVQRVVSTGKKLIDRQHPGRHTLILGDSLDTVPKYAAENPGTMFDLVFIDGGHDYDVAHGDIENMRALAGPSTIVVMDDVIPEKRYGIGPWRAWSDAIDQGVVEQHSVTREGPRGWALGRYL